jgi:hypothetical protein
MTCSSCPSSAKKDLIPLNKYSSSSTGKQTYYNVTAVSVIKFEITIDGKTNTFSQSVSASASDNLKSKAVEDASNLAKSLTKKLIREQLTIYNIPYHRKNSSENKNVRAQSELHVNVEVLSRT